MTDHGTNIGWTHGEGFKGETWNPVIGCSKVSPGCHHCYAETLSLRFGWTPQPWTPAHAGENVILKPERLDQPMRWSAPRMVFVNSMSDLFHEQIPDHYIAQVFDIMDGCRQHVFQVLTKRPERARDFLRGYYEPEVEMFKPERCPLPNVWLGVSIESMRFTYRADVLRDTPAALRFISAEPLLGSLFSRTETPEAGFLIPGQGSDGATANAPAQRRDVGHSRASADGVGRLSEDRVTSHETRQGHSGVDAQSGADDPRSKAPLVLAGIDWLIVGGESGGQESRPMHPDWARELRDVCTAHEIPFFFKQWGSHGETMRYVGRAPKSGGKNLDGREWCEIPSPHGQMALL